MSGKRFAHIPPQTVRFWAWVDSGVTWSLAMPFMAPKFIAAIYWLNGLLGFNGTAPVFDAIHYVFVCLLGVLISIWVVARLLHSEGLMAVIDGYGRLAVSVLLVYFVAFANAPPALLLFVLTEGLGAVAQLRAAYWPPVNRAG